MATIHPYILAQSAIWTEEFSYLLWWNGQSSVDHAHKNSVINVSRNDEWRTSGSTCVDSTATSTMSCHFFSFSSAQLKRTPVAYRCSTHANFMFFNFNRGDTGAHHVRHGQRRQCTTSFTIQFNVFNAYVHRACEMEERGKDHNNKSFYRFTITLHMTVLVCSLKH